MLKTEEFMKTAVIHVNKILVLLLISFLLIGCGTSKTEEVTCVADTGELGGNYASSKSTLHYVFENSSLSKIQMTMDVYFSELNTLSDAEKDNSIQELLSDYEGYEHMEASSTKIDSNHYQVILKIDYKNLSKEELQNFTYTTRQVHDIKYLAESYEAQGYKCE